LPNFPENPKIDKRKRLLQRWGMGVKMGYFCENKVLEYKDCMKLVILLAFLVACSLQGEDKPYKGPSEKDVIELDPNTFQDIVYSSEEPWLIELYAPWCGHCTSLRPEWAKLATSLQGKIKVAKIDPSDNAHRPRFHKLYELVGFPRIIMLPEGTPLSTQAPKRRASTRSTRAPGLPRPSRSGPSRG
jgi:thiol-disulfide isomerase/thioredoxin